MFHGYGGFGRYGVSSGSSVRKAGVSVGLWQNGISLKASQYREA